MLIKACGREAWRIFNEVYLQLKRISSTQGTLLERSEQMLWLSRVWNINA